MNLDDLKAFVATAQAGGVHAAGQQVHKTQSAISKAVRRLEKQLGLQLIDRAGYRAAATNAGEAILRRAEIVLMQLNQLESFAISLARGQEERIRLAVHSSLPDPMWAQFVAVATRQFPDTVLHIRREEVTGAVRRLERKEVDLAITPWDAREADALHVACKIGRISVVNVVRADRMDGHDSRDARSVCRTLHQVIVIDSVADDGLSYGVFEGLRQIRVPDQTTKTALILEGLGWGRVPRHQIEEELANGKLIEITGEGLPTSMTFPVYCLKLKTQHMGPVLHAIWELAKQLS